MKTEIKEIYKCDHCNKLYQLKHFAKKHEKACKYNPDNIRACHDCIHLKKKKYLIVDYYEDEGYGTGNRNVDLLHCDKINSYLYPVSVELKGNAFYLGDELNQPFKKECEFFKEHEMLMSFEEFLQY